MQLPGKTIFSQANGVNHVGRCLLELSSWGVPPGCNEQLCIAEVCHATAVVCYLAEIGCSTLLKAPAAGQL